MLYLAKVQRNSNQDASQLLLMAQQSGEQEWIALPAGVETIPLLEETHAYSDGDPVLVDLDDESKITDVKDATPWLLDLVNRYLGVGLSPEAMKQEFERIEQWRKSLTLKSQDIVRQTLEVETRRDQIQELETKLEQERKQIESMTQQLQSLETKLEQERKQLKLVDHAEDTDTRLPDPTNTLG